MLDLKSKKGICLSGFEHENNRPIYIYIFDCHTIHRSVALHVVIFVPENGTNS